MVIQMFTDFGQCLDDDDDDDDNLFSVKKPNPSHLQDQCSADSQQGAEPGDAVTDGTAMSSLDDGNSSSQNLSFGTNREEKNCGKSNHEPHHL